MNRSFYFISFLIFLNCSNEAEPIVYGTDMCHFCKMTIVTKTHAAQLVTNKGKQYKFDAIECMIHFLADKSKLLSDSKLLISDYSHPGTMIDATSSTYVISPQIQSPMGANLTGFKSLSEAKKLVQKDAAFFDWKGINAKLN